MADQMNLNGDHDTSALLNLNMDDGQKRAVEPGFADRKLIPLCVTVLVHSEFEEEIRQSGRQSADVMATIQTALESSLNEREMTKVRKTQDTLECSYEVKKNHVRKLLFSLLDDQCGEKSGFILGRSYGIVYLVRTLDDVSMANVRRAIRTFQESGRVRDFATLILARDSVNVQDARTGSSVGSESTMHIMEVGRQYKPKDHPFRKFVGSMDAIRDKSAGPPAGKSSKKSAKEKEALVDMAMALVAPVLNL